MHEIPGETQADETNNLALLLAVLSFVLLFAGFFLYADKSETLGTFLIIGAGFTCGMGIPNSLRTKDPVFTGILLFMLLVCSGATYVLMSGGANLLVLIVGAIVAFSTGQLAAMRGVFTGVFASKAASLTQRRG
jgi:hypothetical protein